MSRNPEAPYESSLLNESVLKVYLKKVVAFLESRDNEEFRSFRASGFMRDHEENYKEFVFWTARKKLGFLKWKKDDVGKGKILDAVISAVEQEDNNFVLWRNWHNPEDNEHKDLCLAKKDPTMIQEWEKIFYRFYKEDSITEEEAFNEFLKFTKRYPLIAYFFFIKDKEKYLPLKPIVFDGIFKTLKFPFRPSPNCSWKNYLDYLRVVKAVQTFLKAELDEDVSLLDSHSFLFILRYPEFVKSFFPNGSIKGGFEEPGPAPSLGEYFEGAEKRYVQTRRERDPRLKKGALLKYGHLCMACGFDFDAVYGLELADGYIELHHTRPVSEGKGERVTKLEDVVVVCSNCHRMIHKRDPLLDWKEVKKYFEKNKSTR